MFIIKYIFFVLVLVQVACSIEKENPVQKEIDYKLRVHKSGEDLSLRSADLTNVNLRDRILFYDGQEAFPILSDKSIDQYENLNIKYISVESTCRGDGKDYYKRLQIKASKFYFYQIIKEDLLLWPHKEIKCDFVFHPHFLSGSTNSVQKSFVINMSKAVTFPSLENDEYDFTSKALSLDSSAEFTKLCLNTKKELVKDSKEFSFEKSILSCRYLIKEGDKVVLSSLFLDKNIPLLRLNYLSTDFGGDKSNASELEITNISQNTVKLKIPSQIGYQRWHHKSAPYAESTNQIFSFPFHISKISTQYKRESSYYILSINPSENFRLQARNACRSFMIMDDKATSAIDTVFTANWLQISLGEDEKYYSFNPQKIGIDMEAINKNNNSLLAHNGHKIRMDQNCQFVR